MRSEQGQRARDVEERHAAGRDSRRGVAFLMNIASSLRMCGVAPLSARAYSDGVANMRWG